MKPIHNAPTQATTYGKYKPFAWVSDRIRADEYTSNQTGKIITEAVLCLDNNDLSPVVIDRPTVERLENCHCCFAGYPHSTALCNNRKK